MLAIRSITDGELTYVGAAKAFGVSESTITKWMRRHREGEQVQRRRGRKAGERRLLKSGQEDAIRNLVCTKNPDQLQLPFFLWTREAVQALIRERYGVEVAIRTVGEYLARWGMTPQKPVQRALEQNPEKVKRWLEVEYPAIRRKARQEGAQILWADEMGLRSDDQVGRSYGERGKTPVIRRTGKRFGINMISAIGNQGQLCFEVFAGTMNSDRFIQFLKHLIRHAKGRKVFLVVDGHSSHVSKKTKAFVARNAEKLRLFRLPGYSPQLNPDEFLNHDTKRAVSAMGPRASTLDELICKVRRHLWRRQRQPSVVAALFHHPDVQYAM